MSDLGINDVQRLEVILENPNPLFEKWLTHWLKEAERRNAKSQFQLREALQALRSFPLPLSTGRECEILRGFGAKLCSQIDEELEKYKKSNIINTTNAMTTYQNEIQQVIETVKKKRKKQPKTKDVPPVAKISKRMQKVLDEEEERQRQVIMQPNAFEICLLVDTQETSGKNKRLLDDIRSYLESLKIVYEVRRLTIGDFLWIARDTSGNELVLPYIVERKRMDDLASSVRDGRFHEQKHRLGQCGIENVIYLVEDYGDNNQVGLPLDSLQQAMINTQVHSGFKIKRTENHFCSILYLQALTEKLKDLYANKELVSKTKEELDLKTDVGSSVGLLKFKTLYDDSTRNAQLTVREVFVQQLLQLHSLSLEKILAIVEVYGTPRQLFDAYAACATAQEARMLLANVRCGDMERPLGDKLSQTIFGFYNNIF